MAKSNRSRHRGGNATAAGARGGVGANPAGQRGHTRLIGPDFSVEVHTPPVEAPVPSAPLAAPQNSAHVDGAEHAEPAPQNEHLQDDHPAEDPAPLSAAAPAAPANLATGQPIKIESHNPTPPGAADVAAAPAPRAPHDLIDSQDNPTSSAPAIAGFTPYAPEAPDASVGGYAAAHGPDAAANWAGTNGENSDETQRAQITGPGDTLAVPEISISEGPPMLFEVAWEVCWQLGGIYTVMRSKAPAMVKTWGDRYCLIGPYNANTAVVEFEPAIPHGTLGLVIDRLRSMGITAHYGYWLITGRPQVILIDFLSAFHRLGEFKYFLWKDHGITAPDSDPEVHNVLMFGFLVGLFFQELSHAPGVHKPILAHFHEWMAGLGVMRIKALNLPVATVFTTHATILGRYLCTDNPDFYAKLPWINPDHAAGHYNIYARYCMERGATNSADVFTTVSDITALEAEKLLGRRADVITPNGLNIQKFAALHEFQNLHKHYKEMIHEFVMAHFFPSYTFDLERTIYLFTSGRYEFTNKGINLFIESLARLNHWLKAGGIGVNVVAFIITRAPYRSVNVDVLKSQAMFDELKLVCGRITEEMGDSLLRAVSIGRLPERGELLTEEAIVRLKRGLHAWKTHRQPAIVTHDLVDDANDPILQQLRACRLFNAQDDPVKVVFHPDFLSATSPLIGLDYDQFVRGCHMGVFPSYYEPWGYTPMECVASGVPAVTSDLAGFGSYVLTHIQEPATNGLFVIGRRFADFHHAAHQLTEALFHFALNDRRGRIELRNRTERLSEYFDWSNLISHYAQAHRMAVARKTGVAA